MKSEAVSVTDLEGASWASNALRNLRLSAEARGLRFFVNPPREVLPAFLGDFRPDAIAVGPSGGIVMEFKHGQHPRTNRTLAAISEKVSREKGWEFRAIYLTPPADQVPSIAVPTWDQLHGALGAVEALTVGGHRAPALLAGWSVLEALARLARAHDGTGATRPLSPLQAVQALAEEGYVEEDVAARLRGLARMRNAVAHGDLSVEVTVEQAEELLRDLRAIFLAVEAVEAASAER